MTVHKNARLTPRSRVLMIERIESGMPLGAAATAAGVSRQTPWRWLRRYRSGDRDLKDHSSAPHRCPHQLRPEHVVAQVEALRRQRLTSPMIARMLGLATSTVGLVLRRIGLNRLAKLDPVLPANRCEHAHPGDLINIDTKELGRIEQSGHRIHGDRTRCGRRLGWEYLHAAVDDCSRSPIPRCCPPRPVPPVRASSKELPHRSQPIASPRRLMTDNAFRLQDQCPVQAGLEAIGARNVTTRPYTPRTNGKAERFIQTALREWLDVRPYVRSQFRTAEMTPWLHWYTPSSTALSPQDHPSQSCRQTAWKRQLATNSSEMEQCLRVRRRVGC